MESRNRPAASPIPRIGLGVDVHKYAQDPVRPLRLACLEWPGELALEGHSDGDAVAHAIVDAVAGAAGLGDIGTIFGTDQPQWANAAGSVFLTHLRGLIAKAGFTIGNISVVIVGNAPRINTRRREAEATLTNLLGAAVTLTATTTDGLGLTGRGEGVAAIATAILL